MRQATIDPCYVWTVVLLMALSGCASDARQTGVSVRDSAGIVVVQHRGALPSGVEHWRLESTPLLDIGVADGDEAQLFTNIIQATTLPQGELLVADAGAHEIRIFDETGRLVRRFGREGGGPGEFRRLSWVGVERSGVIAAFDPRQNRLTRFSADGVVRQEVRIPQWPRTGSIRTVKGLLGDGSLLMQSIVGLPSVEEFADLSVGLVRDSIGLLLFAPKESQETELGRFPGVQQLRAAGRVIAMGPAPFALSTAVAVADTVVYIGTKETYEIQVYDMRDGSGVFFGARLRRGRSRQKPRSDGSSSKTSGSRSGKGGLHPR